MSRNLDHLHPLLKPLCEQFIEKCREQGILIIITCTYRSKEEQDALYAQGRTKSGKKVTNAKGGKSKHNHTVNGKPASLAFDIAIKGKNGGLNWNGQTAPWQIAGKIGKSLGLVWGGDWTTIKDYPHFELGEK